MCPFQNDVVIKVDDVSDIELQENTLEVEDHSEKHTHERYIRRSSSVESIRDHSEEPTHERYIHRSSSVESTRSSIVRVNVIVSVCSRSTFCEISELFSCSMFSAVASVHVCIYENESGISAERYIDIHYFSLYIVLKKNITYLDLMHW